MNCHDKIYHQNKVGSAKKCSCHGAVHLNFGNVSLLLSRTQLGDLSTHIQETILIECGVEDEDERCIYLPTRDYCLMFAMTYNELKGLSEILDQTLLMMQVDDALTTNSL